MNKPNIIYIMADDLGYGDFQSYNKDSKIPTPNADRLAKEGMCFTDAHSSSAVCSPSRYSVLTGRYCWRTWLERGVLWGNDQPLIDKNRPTIATLLKDNGYKTAAIGKWHVGLGWKYKDGLSHNEEVRVPYRVVDYTQLLDDCPTDHGFDYSYIIAASLNMEPFCFIENNKTVGVPSIHKVKRYGNQKDGFQVEDWDDSKVDTTFTEKSIEFIKKSKEEDPNRPFFLYMTPSCPHRPCGIPVDFAIGKSEAGDRGDMVWLFDWILGQISATLDELNIVDETLLIISSDNGAELKCENGQDYEHKSCGNLRGQKADIWEGGHREPFIVRWPGKVKAGSTNDSLICLGDLYATFADLLDTSLLDNTAEDSFSFLDSLLGKIHSKDKPKRKTIVHHSIQGMFSYRDGFIKMIRGVGSGGFGKRNISKKDLKSKVKRLLNIDVPGQLYDLETDLLERKNLWKSKRNVAEKMLYELKVSIETGRTRPLSKE